MSEKLRGFKTHHLREVPLAVSADVPIILQRVRKVQVQFYLSFTVLPVNVYRLNVSGSCQHDQKRLQDGLAGSYSLLHYCQNVWGIVTRIGLPGRELTKTRCEELRCLAGLLKHRFSFVVGSLGQSTRD